MALFEQQVQDHITNFNNPHRVNKNDIELGLVENLPIASETIAREAKSTQHYITPRRLRDVFDGILMQQGLMDQHRNVILPD